jgi:hypothetical protein
MTSGSLGEMKESVGNVSDIADLILTGTRREACNSPCGILVL